MTFEIFQNNSVVQKFIIDKNDIPIDSIVNNLNINFQNKLMLFIDYNNKFDYFQIIEFEHPHYNDAKISVREYEQMSHDESIENMRVFVKFLNRSLLEGENNWLWLTSRHVLEAYLVH